MTMAATVHVDLSQTRPGAGAALADARCSLVTLPRTGRRLGVGLALCLALAVLPARACNVSEAEPVAVLRLAGTGDVLLADDRTATLEGINWPARDEPGARAALLAELDLLLAAGPVRALFTGAQDRWQRRPAQLAVSAGHETIWVQGMLLEYGLTYAWPGEAAPRCWQELLAREANARKAGRGIWAGMRNPSHISPRLVYEGIVRSVRPGRRVTFVNFDGPRDQAPGWMLTARQVESFRQAGRDPATFVGKRLRLRATVEQGEKRRLTVVAPHMVEVLE